MELSRIRITQKAGAVLRVILRIIGESEERRMRLKPSHRDKRRGWLTIDRERQAIKFFGSVAGQCFS